MSSKIIFNILLEFNYKSLSYLTFNLLQKLKRSFEILNTLRLTRISDRTIKYQP